MVEWLNKGLTSVPSPTNEPYGSDPHAKLDCKVGPARRRDSAYPRQLSPLIGWARTAIGRCVRYVPIEGPPRDRLAGVLRFQADKRVDHAAGHSRKDITKVANTRPVQCQQA
eukprot:1188228-Prorocentrum_minimum.AAC.3